MSTTYTIPTTYTKLLTYHSTCPTFPTLTLAGTSQPASVDVVGATGNYGVVRCERNHLSLIPYGTNSANDLFKIRVYRLNRAWTMRTAGASLLQWIPTQLLEATCTLSTVTGTASLIVVATDYLCDSIAVDAAKSYTQYTAVNNANNVAGSFLVCDMLGGEYAAITFELSTGAASMNALYGWLA